MRVRDKVVGQSGKPFGRSLQKDFSAVPAGSSAPFRHIIPLLPLLPLVLLFAGGLCLALGQSFGMWLPFAYDGGVWDAYTALAQPHVFKSILLSLWVAFVSAFLAVWLGLFLAYGVWKLPDTLQKYAVIYKAPLVLPHIAVGFIILVFWGKSGILSSLAYHLGAIEQTGDFPTITYSPYGLGLIMAYVLKGAPFVIILAYGMLKRFDFRLVQTARMLGGSESIIFFRLIVPFLKPVLHTAFIILFLYAVGAFDIPFLIGGSVPEMLPIKIYNLYFKRELTDRPQAMAILSLMFLFSAVFIAGYLRLAGRMHQEERKL